MGSYPSPHTTAPSHVTLDAVADVEHRMVDPSDPTAPPSAFAVSSALKKALPRNVLFVDFENSAEALRAAMALHPAGPSVPEIIADNGAFRIKVRTVGTFDDPTASGGATLRRGVATLVIKCAGPTSFDSGFAPVFELVDGKVALDGQVTMTEDLASFVLALGAPGTSFRATWPIRSTVALPPYVSALELELVG